MCTKLTREGIVYIWFDLMMKDGLNNWNYYVMGCLYNVDTNTFNI